MKKRSYSLLVFLLMLFISFMAQGAMQSDDYRIPTAVFSGGGTSMGSETYQTEATLGQSSPLMDPAEPPSSTSYDLYPGFWYTLEVGMPVCDDLASFAAAYGSITGDTHYSFACDLDGDGDVDGSDLAGF